VAMGVSSRHTAEQDASVGRLEEATNGAEGERRRRGLFSAGFDRVSRMVVTRKGRHGEGEGWRMPRAAVCRFVREARTTHLYTCFRTCDDAVESSGRSLPARFDD